MEIKRGIVYSILFHLFLALIFTLVNCNTNVKPPEPIELGISMVAEQGVDKVSEMGAAVGAKQEQKGTIPVKMPKVNAPPLGVEKISQEKTEKIGEGIIDTLLSKIEKGGKNLQPKPSLGSDETTVTGEKKGMPFSITGELSNRKIIKKIIPSYPKGYEERTRVMVKITVDPKGAVKQLILLKTGGEIFDRITLEALREWRWQPIPPAAEQTDQQGVITFFYELK